MSARRLSPLLLVFAVLGVGCARTVGDREVFSNAELNALPHSCTATLDRGAQPIALGAIEDQSSVLLLETTEGACIADAAALIDSLRDHRQVRFLQRLSRSDSARAYPAVFDFSGEDTVGADPSPHPDRPGTGAGADPYPHPDSNADAETSADPHPHPDNDPDEIVIVIWIVIDISPSPPPAESAAAPAPSSPDPQPAPSNPT